MPPERRFSKEQIIDAAFEIATEDGIEGLTVRKVAEKIGSSVAPMYVNFKDVSALKEAVVQKVFAIGRQMLQKEYTGERFLDIGIASLRFAKVYPVLFRELMLTDSNYMDDYPQELGDAVIGEMASDPDLAGFTEDEMKTMFLKMRIFQLGLSVMVANGLLPEEVDEEAQIELLASTGEDVIAGTRMRKRDD